MTTFICKCVVLYKIYKLCTTHQILDDQPREDRWAEHVAHMRAMRSTFNILVGKLEEKRPLGRPNLVLEDNMRMYLKEIHCEKMSCKAVLRAGQGVGRPRPRASGGGGCFPRIDITMYEILRTQLQLKR
jgi:hypothetical protein